MLLTAGTYDEAVLFVEVVIVSHVVDYVSTDYGFHYFESV
jgi:hypothetical protein